MKYSPVRINVIFCSVKTLNLYMMTIKNILRIGDPLLTQISEAVIDPATNEIKELIDDMFDTMRHYEGVGLAAPQIGILSRIVIFGFTNNPRYPTANAVPETILINPQIDILSDEMESDWEGCLSVPGLRGWVPRSNAIRYTGLDRQGARIEREVSGFHARVVLHECDHLDGIIYPQRIESLADFGFIEELEQHGRYSRLPCDTE